MLQVIFRTSFLQDTESASHHHAEYVGELSADQKKPDDLSELLDLEKRVKAVEKAVIEIGRHMAQENINANAKLEAAMRQIEEQKLKGGSNPDNVRDHMRSLSRRMDF